MQPGHIWLIRKPRRASRSGVGPRRKVRYLFVVVVVGAALVIPQTSSAATTADICSSTARIGDWSAAIGKAQTALTGVINSIENQSYAKAVKRLQVLRHAIRKGHTAASALIGVPPKGEQEEPPGVRAVLKVNALEHKVTMQLVPLFDGLKRAGVVSPLGATLKVNVACRDVMLAKVIDLRPGRGAYSDGLSDTLPDYKQELSLTSNALATYDLTDEGRSSIDAVQTVITSTQRAMKGAFGGGE